MTAAQRYLAHMRTLWPRWNLEPFRDYADDGPASEPGLESQLAAWRDAYLLQRFPNEYERGLTASWDEGTFRLGGDRLRMFPFLFCPFVYGDDLGTLRDERDTVPVPVPDAATEQETRVTAFLAHLEALETHFTSLAGNPDAPPFHDTALLITISLHEGRVTSAFTSSRHGRVADPTRLAARHQPDDVRWPDTLRYISAQGNLHSFWDHGLDHLGPAVAGFRRRGWIPPGYDDDGGRDTWLYDSMGATATVPATIYPGNTTRRDVLANCYLGNAYDNYSHDENKCFNAAVLPRGDALMATAMTIWSKARQVEEAFQEPDLFPGESVASLPAFFRRLIILFAFGDGGIRRPSAVRRDRVLARRVTRMARRGAVADVGMPRHARSVGALLKFFKESAGTRTAAVTAADPAFYTDLYAHFAYTHSVPRNRFWRAYVADLLEHADVLRAPPPP